MFTAKTHPEMRPLAIPYTCNLLRLDDVLGACGLAEKKLDYLNIESIMFHCLRNRTAKLVLRFEVGPFFAADIF